MLKKLEGWEKISKHPPQLEVVYLPPYLNLQVFMSSKRYAMPPDEDGTHVINRITAGKWAHLFDASCLLDMVKTMIKGVTDDYYDALMEKEMYELPEHLDGKISDTVIIIDGDKDSND